MTRPIACAKSGQDSPAWAASAQSGQDSLSLAACAKPGQNSLTLVASAKSGPVRKKEPNQQVAVLPCGSQGDGYQTDTQARLGDPAGSLGRKTVVEVVNFGGAGDETTSTSSGSSSTNGSLSGAR